MANATNRLNVFPVFFKVADKVAVVVGNGAEAMAKARLLGESNVRVRLISQDPSVELAAYVLQSGLEHVRSDFDPAMLAGAILVFAATGDADLDFEIVSAARSLNIPANAVDRPEICDFYTPAIVNRAPIAVAIGSEGTGPVLTQMIRSRVEAILPRSTGSLARLAALYRVAVDHLVPRGVSRRQFWQSFFGGDVARLVERGEMPAARRAATRLLKGARPEGARATIVPISVGEPDLLTLRAVRAMQEADAIVFFAGTDPALVAMGRRDAERFEVLLQASIPELAHVIAAHAQDGHHVAVLLDRTASCHAEIATELQSRQISTTILPGIADDGAVRIRPDIAA
jgi:uroporphyrin-III C-methyltransferase / precorrin-2 dehydrogenase / sirohydrochlorin ferrochelatase